MTGRLPTSTESLPAPRDRPFRLLEILVIAAAAAEIVCFTSPRILSANDMSRMATVESLVDRGTFTIDGSPYVGTLDKVEIDGHFYSSKPPLYSALMAGEFWILHHFFGLEISPDRRDPNRSPPLVIWILTVTWVGLPYVVTLIFFRTMLHDWVLSPVVRLVYLFAAAFANHAAGFAVTINNHVPAAVCLFASAYLAVGLIHGKLAPTWWRFVLAGFWAGLLPTMDLPGMFFSAPIALYLVKKFPRETFTWFAFGALPPLAAHFALTIGSTGGWLPVYLRRSLYDYPGSYWLHPHGINNLHDPKWLYLFNILLGHHGLFSLFPIMIFSAAALLAAVGRRDVPLRRECLVFGGVVVFTVVFYVFTTTNYGGASYGFRWFILLTPALLWAGALYMDTVNSRWTWGLFVLLLVLSLISTQHCQHQPWSDFRNWTPRFRNLV